MLRLALLITSDSVYRGEKKDEITPLVRSREGKTFRLVASRIVPNRIEEIRAAVLELSRSADILLVTGGTGLSPRDISIEAVELLARKRIPGLGEEHRRRSYQQIGHRALVSRAEGFVVGDALVFVSPGSPNAVGIALDILEEVGIHASEEIKGIAHGRGGRQVY